jgi:hypothetical protein
VLTDVRVFAVNNRTERVVEDEQVVNAKTVSVLVKRDQVEVLMLAMEMGAIRLSLRGHTDTEGGSSTGADVNMLVNNPADKADDDNNRPPVDPGGSSFKEFLNQQKKSEPEVQAVAQLTEPTGPLQKMAIHTPDGVTLYTWRNPGQLPDVRSLGTGGAPAQAPALPADLSGPADDSQVSDDSSPGDGYQPEASDEEKPADDNTSTGKSSAGKRDDAE